MNLAQNSEEKRQTLSFSLEQNGLKLRTYVTCLAINHFESPAKEQGKEEQFYTSNCLI